MNWRKLLSNALLIVMILGFASCLNDDEENFGADADVYFINKYIDTAWMHGTAYYVYANQNLASASVVKPVSQETVELEPLAGFFGVSAFSPEDEDYSLDAPEEGNYEFQVSNQKDEVLYLTDDQEFEDLEGAKIDTIDFNSAALIMRLTWNEITDCDGYYVKMYDSSDKLIFDGYVVDSETTNFAIATNYSSGKWSEPPVEGEEYSILLHTFVFDDDATASNSAYNIKEITITDTTTVWDF